MIEAAIVALIWICVPMLYKSGEKKKQEHIKNGKIYYGIFRMFFLLLLSICIADSLLYICIKNPEKIEGINCLILTALITCPIMIIFMHFYKNHYKKLIYQNLKLANNKSDKILKDNINKTQKINNETIIQQQQCEVCGKYTNELKKGVCPECYNEIMDRLKNKSAKRTLHKPKL